MLASAQLGEQFYFGATKTLAWGGQQRAPAAQLIDLKAQAPLGSAHSLTPSLLPSQTYRQGNFGLF